MVMRTSSHEHRAHTKTNIEVSALIIFLLYSNNKLCNHASIMSHVKSHLQMCAGGEGGKEMSLKLQGNKITDKITDRTSHRFKNTQIPNLQITEYGVA